MNMFGRKSHPFGVSFFAFCSSEMSGFSPEMRDRSRNGNFYVEIFPPPHVTGQVRFWSEKRLFWIIAIAVTSFLSSCKEPAVVETPDQPTTGLFRDPDHQFTVPVPITFAYTVTDNGNVKTHEFVKKDEEGDVLELIRVAVEIPDNGDANLFSSTYENRYASTCKCAIVERGVVNFQGKPARQYHVTLKNGTWVSYQLHTIIRNRYVLIGTRGPQENSASLHKLFQQTTGGFQVLPE